jgi:hypothetical protein
MLGVESGKKLEQYNQLTEWMINHQRQVSQDEINNAAPIRQEYLKDPGTVAYQTMGQQYLKILGANKEGAELAKKGMERGISDQAMIYGIVTAFDVGSHVLQGEQDAVTKNTSVIGFMQGLKDKLLKGSKLNPAEREGILNTANALYTQTQNVHNKTVKPVYESYAANAKVRSGLVTSSLDFASSINNFKDRGKLHSGNDRPVDYNGYTFPNQAALDKYLKASGEKK